MYRYIFVFAFLLMPILSHAQLGWLPGYIVTNSLDTLHGKIYYSTSGQRSAKCVFKEDGYNDKVKYRPFTIRGYYVNGSYYISRIYDIHPSLTYGLGVFMEYVNEGEGPVMLLRYRNTDLEFGYFQTFLVKKGETTHEIDYMRFRKTAAAYFSDYPKLQEDILAKKFKKSEIAKIVKRYNSWYKVMKTTGEKK